MSIDQSILLPGDCLLYRPSSPMGWVIAVKTWTRISHVEVYRGNGQSWASRDGVGVNVYPLRTANLGYVRRPHWNSMDGAKASAWFEYVETIAQTRTHARRMEWRDGSVAMIVSGCGVMKDATRDNLAFESKLNDFVAVLCFSAVSVVHSFVKW